MTTDCAPQPDFPRRDMTSAELKALLAHFSHAGSAAEERADIDAVFGEDRLDE